MTTIVHMVAVPDRYRGFMASVGTEIGSGLYVCPLMSKGVRERVWETLEAWWDTLPGGSLVMIWRDTSSPGELAIKTLGERRYEPIEIDGLILIRS